MPKGHKLDCKCAVCKAKNGNPTIYWKGKHFSEETRKKISDSLKGENHPMFGKHHTEESKRMISNTLRGNKCALKPIEEIGNKGLHKRLRKENPPSKHCTMCGEKSDRLELANLSGEYYRCIEDYKYMCSYCHKAYDSMSNDSLKGE